MFVALTNKLTSTFCWVHFHHLGCGSKCTLRWGGIQICCLKIILSLSSYLRWSRNEEGEPEGWPDCWSANAFIAALSCISWRSIRAILASKTGSCDVIMEPRLVASVGEDADDAPPMDTAAGANPVLPPLLFRVAVLLGRSCSVVVVLKLSLFALPATSNTPVSVDPVPLTAKFGEALLGATIWCTSALSILSVV